MDKIAETAFKSFEGFIKRAVVPSSSFLFIFAVLYLWFGSFYDHDYVEWVKGRFVFEWYVYAMIFVDYTLYQLLRKTVDTKSYVDDAKAIGIFAISLMINLLIAGWVADCRHYFLYASAAVFLVWTIGFELTRQRYKSQAARVYLTYLYGDVL